MKVNIFSPHYSPDRMEFSLIFCLMSKLNEADKLNTVSSIWVSGHSGIEEERTIFPSERISERHSSECTSVQNQFVILS